uniref:Protein kinase domain-containing protein n=1 Tax=viral metagenome TaxID=1070528 RepID=A0A6C0D7P2_9ZZZZ
MEVKEFSLNDLDIELNFNNLNIDFKEIKNKLLNEDVKGYLINKKNKTRCLIEYIKEYYRGGYGKLYLVKRTTNIKEYCLVKMPIHNDSNLLTEALLQYMSYKVLESLKLEYMLAKIYDIYTKNSIVHFSMELKNGVFFHNFIQESKNPERDFIHCFLQICIALYYLETVICLDHRDLHYTNILLIKKPVNINININNTNYILNSEFHICILDFGFACTGLNKTCINSSEDMFKISDNCMKPGRDIFQLLASVWCIKELRNKMKSSFCDFIDLLFKYDKYDYTSIIKDESKADWSYIITNKNNFSFPPLVSENLLNTLYRLKDTY